MAGLTTHSEISMQPTSVRAGQHGCVGDVVFELLNSGRIATLLECGIIEFLD